VCENVLGGSVKYKMLFALKEADCRLNWAMPKKTDVEALLPMLANIARDRPDIISAKEFRKILVDMGLAFPLFLPPATMRGFSFFSRKMITLTLE